MQEKQQKEALPEESQIKIKGNAQIQLALDEQMHSNTVQEGGNDSLEGILDSGTSTIRLPNQSMGNSIEDDNVRP